MTTNKHAASARRTQLAAMTVQLTVMVERAKLEIKQLVARYAPGGLKLSEIPGLGRALRAQRACAAHSGSASWSSGAPEPACLAPPLSGGDVSAPARST